MHVSSLNHRLRLFFIHSVISSSAPPLLQDQSSTPGPLEALGPSLNSHALTTTSIAHSSTDLFSYL
jgi:hypothetical protein